MATCSFCKTTLAHGTGKQVIHNNGKIDYFCSSKCEKNMKMGRNPKKLKWTRSQK